MMNDKIEGRGTRMGASSLVLENNHHIFMFQDIYEEMGALSTSVQREMLNCTYPALYVVMFAIMEVNIV